MVTVEVTGNVAGGGFQPIRTLAVRFRQGGRIVYSIAPRMTDMLGLVPPRVDPDVMRDANRRLNEGHGRDFGDYLWEQNDWVAGALMIGVPEGLLGFEEIRGTSGQFGWVSFPMSALNSVAIKLFDGQHRRFGSQHVIEREHAKVEELRRLIRKTSESPDRAATVAQLERQLDEKLERLETLENEAIPILIYEEGSIESLQQMFSDAAKARPPDAITVARFDMRNPFNVAANALSQEHDLLMGRIEFERSTLSSRSNSLATLNQLSNSVLKTLFVGAGGRVSRRRLSELTVEEIEQRGREFLDDLVQAREELQRVVAGEIEPLELREQHSMLVSVTLQRVLAGLWHEVVAQQGAERSRFIEFLAGVEMNPSENGLWVRAGLVTAAGTDGDHLPISRAQEVRRAVNMAMVAFWSTDQIPA